jgi:hypothetical protein
MGHRAWGMGHRAQGTGHGAWGIEFNWKFRLFSGRHGDNEKWKQGDLETEKLRASGPVAECFSKSDMFWSKILNSLEKCIEATGIRAHELKKIPDPFRKRTQYQVIELDKSLCALCFSMCLCVKKRARHIEKGKKGE